MNDNKNKKAKFLSIITGGATIVASALTLYSIIEQQTNFNKADPKFEFLLDKGFSKLNSDEINNVKNYKISSKNGSKIIFLRARKNNDINGLEIEYYVELNNKKSGLMKSVVYINPEILNIKPDTTASKTKFDETKTKVNKYIATLDQTKDKPIIDNLTNAVAAGQNVVDKPEATNAEITLESINLENKLENIKAKEALKAELEKIKNIETKNEQAKSKKEQTIAELTAVINNDNATNIELAVSLAKSKDFASEIEKLNEPVVVIDTTASKTKFDETKTKVNEYIATLDQTKDKPIIDNLTNAVAAGQNVVDKPEATNAEITLESINLENKLENIKAKEALKAELEKIKNIETKNEQAQSKKEQTIAELTAVINNDNATNTELAVSLTKAKDDEFKISYLNNTISVIDAEAAKKSFNNAKVELSAYAKTLDNERDGDLIKLINEIIDKSQKEFDSPNVTNQEIIVLANKLQNHLELTKAKIRIRDLQEQLDSSIKPPSVYIAGDKSKDSILKDYQTKIEEFTNAFTKKTKDLSNKYNSETINESDNKVDFPKAYKEIHDPNNHIKSFNNEFSELLSKEKFWVKNQLSLPEDQREKNSVIVEKINALHQTNYLWMVRTNLEEKIEISREHIRHFIRTLSGMKYQDISNVLVSKLKQKPSQNPAKDYIFTETTTITHLAKINQNLINLLSTIPGKIVKADFLQDVDNDKKHTIPAILNFYRDSDNINESEKPWVLKLKGNGGNVFNQKAFDIEQSVKHIDDIDYVHIHNKISEYYTLKNDYIDAYKKLTEEITDKFIKTEMAKRLGDGNDISDLMNALFEQEKQEKSNNIFNSSSNSGVKNFLSTQRDFILKIIEGMKLLPVSTGVNVLSKGNQARRAYESAILSEITKLETPFTAISNKINEFVNQIKNNKRQYQQTFYDDVNLNTTRFNNFLTAIDKYSGNSTTKVKTIFDKYTEALVNFQWSANSVGEKITNLTSLLKYENNYFKSITPALKSYYDNKMSSAEIKDLLASKLVDSQIIYAFGVEDDGSYGTLFQYGGYAQFSYQSDLFGLTSKHKWSNQSDYLDSFGLLSLTDGLGNMAKKYIKDISRLINNNTSEIVGDKIQSFAYALFLLSDDQEGNEQINKDKNLILNTEIWNWYNGGKSYWVYSLLGDDATYWYHIGIYEILTYLLLGLIDAYQAKYKEVNNHEPDGNYDSKVELDSNNSNIFKYAKFILDVYGVNTFKSWVKSNDNLRFTNFNSETQEFQHNNYAGNSAYSGITSVTIGKDLTSRDITNIDYVNNGQTQTVSSGSEVDAKIWLSQNVKPNLFKAYELLHKELIKLSSNINNEYIKPIINKQFMSLINSETNYHKKIKRNVIKNYTVLDTSSLNDFVWLKNKLKK
ncbi:hypothetical protein KQ874_02815 [Mycoplasma sp. ES3157-GEN-MYC]|uniref:hypothetical protein n=1 Tax=Mycoplasma miroungigenitalium TaxID=754515 RepID=UPI001C126699|nr:hypothetical protein [Mycoplasma miroungigenitalium]MBU4690610.1 hypothetical protein [Mycoplasma miroungigenitalium]